MQLEIATGNRFDGFDRRIVREVKQLVHKPDGSVRYRKHGPRSQPVWTTLRADEFDRLDLRPE